MSTTERPTSHPFNMYRHILDQPDAIAAAVAANRTPAERFAAAVAGKDRLWIVGIGTSYHAALMGEYFMRAFGGGLTTIASHSFDFSLYGPELTDRDAVVVVSHTGRKSYSVEALDRVKATGATLALVTGEEGAERHAGMEHVFTTVPPEGSATYTISYTSALAVLASITGAIGQQRMGAPTLDPDLLATELPAAMRGALETEALVRSLAEAHTGRRKIWLAGAGPAGVSAMEAALKIKARAVPVSRPTGSHDPGRSGWRGPGAHARPRCRDEGSRPRSHRHQRRDARGAARWRGRLGRRPGDRRAILGANDARATPLPGLLVRAEPRDEPGQLSTGR
ncbi:MAG TPA: SIS domain-containing protein [Thermomicrobiales bacterium]|nr:SIS domain-containing protein [Thermomicrobiales bacterium]